MSESLHRHAAAERRIQGFQREMSAATAAVGSWDPAATAQFAVHLAAHAAMAVAVDPGFVHLLRVNFFFDREVLPPWVEARLLLSPLCHEEDDGLYVMDAPVRELLLTRLASFYGPARLRQVAILLWQYTERQPSWADRRELRHAQQITAMNFLEPEHARAWMEDAEQGEGADSLAKDWFVAMHGGLPGLADVSTETGDPSAVCAALLTLDFATQHEAYRRSISEGATAFLVHGPPGHGQRWLLYELLQGSRPIALLEVAAETAVAARPLADLSQALGVTSAPWPRVVQQVAEIGPSSRVALAVHQAERLGPDLITYLFDRTRGALLFLVEYAGVSDGSTGVAGATRLPSTLEPSIVRLPKLEKFAATTLAAWMDAASGTLPALTSGSEERSTLDEAVARAMRASDAGVPERVLEHVCIRCGVRWPEVQAIARAALAPPAIERTEMSSLAREYEETRARMTPGTERTRAMEATVAKMRQLALTRPSWPLATWTESPAAGDRLAAVVVLSEAPDGRYLEWLAGRTADERPFLAYQALAALHRAATELDPGRLAEVEQAVSRARAGLGAGLEWSDRSEMLRRAESVITARQKGALEWLPLLPLPDAVLLPGTTLSTRLAQPRGTKPPGGALQIGQRVFVLWQKQLESPSGGQLVGTIATVIVARERVRGGYEIALEGGLRARSERMRAGTAMIEPYPDHSDTRARDLLETVRTAAAALAKLGRSSRTDRGVLVVAGLTVSLSDQPSFVCYRLAEALRLGPQDRLALLEADNAREKLHQIQQLLLTEIELALPEPQPLSNSRRARLVAVLRTAFPSAQARLRLLRAVGADRGSSASAVDLVALGEARGTIRRLLAHGLALAPTNQLLWKFAQKRPSVKRTAAPRTVAGRTRARLEQLKLWPNGATLSIKFLDGAKRQQRRVILVAKQWLDHANLRFVLLPSRSKEPGDIRISFKEVGGNWSYVGTDARSIPAHEPTMNLGIAIAPGVSEGDIRKAILKEFGHALGLLQEHQSPEATIDWDRKAVLKALTGPPNHWTAEDVTRNLLERVSMRGYRPFDPRSVMMYAIPGEWVKDRKPMGGATELSEGDKRFIAELYPRAAIAAQKPRRPSRKRK